MKLLFETMSLETKVTDPSFDFVDGIAYEIFMNNLQDILGDSITTPGITDEKVSEIVETITSLAGMAYGIAGKFESVRAEFKARQNNQTKSV
jgi:hypothetical protein